MRYIQLTLIILVTLGLAACSNSHHKKEVEQYVAQVKAQPPKPLLPLPPVKEYAIPKYEVADMRSPFQPNVSQESHAKRPKEPLENYPLDALRLVGIITRDKQQWALINAPDGKLYEVTIGQHLGQSDGKIIAIHEKHLDIVEMIEDGNRLTEHHTKLTLWSHARKAAE